MNTKMRVLLSALLLILSLSESYSTVLWDGNAAKGNSVWKLLNFDPNDGTNTITVVNDPTYGSVWQFYKPATGHRCEVHAAKGFQAAEGDVFYIGWRFKLTMPQKTSTNAFFQWKAYNNSPAVYPMDQNYPIVISSTSGGIIHLMHFAPGKIGTELWKTPTVIGEWINIVMKLKVSRDGSVGYIEFWHNGVQQVLNNNGTRYTCRTFDADYCDPKWGVYGGDGTEITNMISNAKIATTYEEASPLSVPPSAPDNLTATPASVSQVNLVWKDNSLIEDNYKIERSADATAWTPLATLASNTTSYTDGSLTANTTYYYRVYASNGFGNSGYSNSAGALIPATAPVAPADLTATAKSISQIDLAWTDNSNNEAGFLIEQSPDGTTWSTLVTAAENATGYSHTGLSTKTTYFYRVRAQNTYGNSAFTSSVNSTTLDIPPVAPGSLTATAFSENQINLSWTDNSNNETGFKIERSADGGTSWAVLATVASDVTAYSNTGLHASLTYHYRIVAINSGGNSDYSNIADAITLNSTTPPSAPTSLSGTATPSQVNLTWIDNSNNEILFRIEQSADGLTGWTSLGTVAANVTTYVNTGLTPSTGYYYRARTENLAGNSEYTPVFSITTPAVPTNIALNKTVTASNVYNNSAAYTAAKAVDGSTSTRWATDNSITSATLEIDLGGVYTFAQTVTREYQSRIATYKIQYWNGFSWADAFSGTTIGATDKTDNFTAVVASKVRLNILTTSIGGPSIYEFAVYGSATTVIVPDAPSSLLATSASSSQIDLAWTDNSSNEALFRIERSSDGSTWEPLATVEANTTGYSATGLTPFTPYYFRVCSENLGGNSATYSNTASAKTDDIAPVAPSNLKATTFSGTQIDLTWSDNSSNEEHFEIERSADGTNWSSLVVLPANATGYSNTGLTAQTTYYYRVFASNTFDNSGYSNVSSALAISKPAAPDNAKATTISATEIKLTWNDNSDSEDNFVVERSTDGTSWSVLETLGANITNYSNTGLTAGTRYYYRVMAKNSVWSSEYSNITDATASGLAIGDVLAEKVDLWYSSTVDNKIRIAYTLPQSSNVRIAIFDMAGKASVINNVNKDKGTHNHILGTSDMAGGVYVLELQTRFGIKTMKIIVVK